MKIIIYFHQIVKFLQWQTLIISWTHPLSYCPARVRSRNLPRRTRPRPHWAPIGPPEGLPERRPSPPAGRSFPAFSPLTRSSNLFSLLTLVFSLVAYLPVDDFFVFFTVSLRFIAFFLLLLRDLLRLWVSNFSNQFHTCTVGYVNFLDSRCCCQKMRWRVKITEKKIHTNRTGPAANADCERARTAEIYNIWWNRSKLDINTASDLTVAGFLSPSRLQHHYHTDVASPKVQIWPGCGRRNVPNNLWRPPRNKQVRCLSRAQVFWLMNQKWSIQVLGAELRWRSTQRVQLRRRTAYTGSTWPK